MPKCEVDLVLCEQMRRFIRENRLSVSGAATKLGVDRTTFWRFCSSGRARSDTRALYREALEKQISNTDMDVAVSSLAQGNHVPQARLPDIELKRIRKTCETVLALLDAYAVQPLDR